MFCQNDSWIRISYINPQCDKGNQTSVKVIHYTDSEICTYINLLFKNGWQLTKDDYELVKF